MRAIYTVFIIIISALVFICAHEGGHYLAAASFDLDPHLSYGGDNTGMIGMSIGVTHAPTTVLQDTVVVMGAFMLPLALALGLIALYNWKGREEFWIMAAIILILVAVTLIPIPEAHQVDANRIYSALLN